MIAHKEIDFDKINVWMVSLYSSNVVQLELKEAIPIKKQGNFGHGPVVVRVGV